MLINFIFYCKCTFEMAVMCLILQKTPWKISMQNCTFLRLESKVERWLMSPIWPGSCLKFFSSDCSLDIVKDDWPPSFDIWWQSQKFYFWMYSPMMHANLPKTCCPSAESHLKMLIYSIFYCKCIFEMAVMHLILQETPWKISMQNLHFWNQHQKLKDDWPPIQCFLRHSH